MSVFSFPRINVKGLIRTDVGTANNDDYSRAQFPPGSPFAGQPLRLADSDLVQALTFNMTDPEWIEWAQQVHTFVQATSPPPPPCTQQSSSQAQDVIQGTQTKADAPPPGQQNVQLIPAEWNYYGNMAFDLGVTGSTAVPVRVVGVQYVDRLVTDPAQDPLIGAELSFKNRADNTGMSTGILNDINPEDVPCSQVFANSLLLQKGDQAIMLGKPSKAVTRWINFQRNANLAGPNGAGACFQCVVPVEELKGQRILQIMAQGQPLPPQFKGVVFRYYIGRSLQKINTYKYKGDAWFKEMTNLYAKKSHNPAYLEVVGTLSPWFENEMESVPVGRLLNPTDKFFCLPPGSVSNGSAFFLAPAVFNVDHTLGLISVDFSGSFPDRYSSTNYDPLQTNDNPKYDLGPVHLVVRQGPRQYDFGPVPYLNLANGDNRGWVFDFSLKGLPAPVLKLVDDGLFALNHATLGDLLAEQEYFIASDQACLFAEQGAAGSTTQSFMNQGPTEVTATVRVFQKGKELSPRTCPDITIWEYDTTPNQDPGQLQKLTSNYKPGQPLVVPASGSGNRLYTFTLPGQQDPPKDYGDLNLMLVPMINLRLLPNDKDFSEYYINPRDPEPVGNDKLTFDVIFREVLHNYYLLYPAMNALIPLNDPDEWSDPEMAGRLYQRTQRSWFDKAEYMPRTRDLSESRRTLLHAWCRKFLQPSSGA